MALRIGYLLPTRESIMEGRPAAAPLLALAERAESLGFDSVWIGDSLTSRPRHEPLTMLAAVAARTRRVALGTAVLLPALRNPVQLAHQAATVDQVSEGRLILGIGIAQDLPKIREEFEAAGVPFEKRVGRLLEGMRLCRALWTGRPVDWDGRWTLRQATIGPIPHRPGGPPIWAGGMVGAARERAAKYFDAWFPNGPQPDRWASGWQEVRDFARTAGRDPSEITGASYLTLYLDEDRSRAQARIDSFLERYYGQPAEALRRAHTFYAGPQEGAAEWLGKYAAAGASHLVLRFAGDHERQMDAVSWLRETIKI